MDTLQISIPHGKNFLPKPQPLPAKSGNGDKKPPRPPVVVAGSGGMFDPEWIYGYLIGLEETLTSPPLPEHAQSELRRRFC